MGQPPVRTSLYVRFLNKSIRRATPFVVILYYILYLYYSARVNKLATRPSGQGTDQVEESVDTGAERGDPIPSPYTESSPAGPEKEMDGALGVPGGQPDVSPSGPNNDNELPEPKV